MQPLLSGGVVAFEPTEGDDRGPYLRQLVDNSPVQPSGEIRALWVVRDALTSPEKIDRCIDLAVSARFQLLFVQVRGRGDTYYSSTLEPPAPDLEYSTSDFDPLTYLLIQAHAAGIAVHAWINVFYVWSNGESAPPPGHVVVTHPDWLIADGNGLRQDEKPVTYWQERGIEGYFLDPSRPEVRKHTAGVVSDLVSRYALDGIHLDYIRYPGSSFGFSLAARTEFELTWGIDPLRVVEDRQGLAATLGTRAAAVLDSLLTGWRVQQVDSMVLAIREAAGVLPLSAAVIPDPERAVLEKGQDWVKWVHTRLVDFVVPMAYNHRPEELLDWLRVMHNGIGRDRMLVGLAVHDGRDRFLSRSINIIRLDHATGFSIFSYNVLADQRFPVRFLEEAIFSGLDTDQHEEPE